MSRNYTEQMLIRVTKQQLKIIADAYKNYLKSVVPKSNEWNAVSITRNEFLRKAMSLGIAALELQTKSEAK